MTFVPLEEQQTEYCNKRVAMVLYCITSFSSFLQFLSRVHQKHILNPFSSECIKSVPYQVDFLSLMFRLYVVMQVPLWPHRQLGMDQMEPFRQSTGRLWLRREVLYG